MKIVDDKGAEIAFGSETSGDLYVRGPWVIDQWFASDSERPLVDGWFPTGDVARIDADGYMQTTDRGKDVIKSGGEWIGSIDLENIAMGHAATALTSSATVRWSDSKSFSLARRASNASPHQCVQSARIAHAQCMQQIEKAGKRGSLVHPLLGRSRWAAFQAARLENLRV